MISRSKRTLLVAAIILLPILVLWGIFGTPSQSKHQAKDRDPDSIDFFINDAEVITWNAQGQRNGAWHAEKLQHRTGAKESDLFSPSGTITTDAGLIYKIQAKKGYFTDSQSEIALAGDVQVHHNPQSGPNQRLSTQSMIYYPEQKLAQTDDLVTFTEGTSSTQAKGLKFYLNERRLELLSDVRGTYDAR